MSDPPDPAISRAQELWKQHQNREAMLVLVKRINELNAAQPTRYTKGKRSLFAGILAGMILTAIIFALVLAGNPNLRWLSDADLTQLGSNNIQIVFTPTPNLAATGEILSERSTAIAGTNVAREMVEMATASAIVTEETQLAEPTLTPEIPPTSTQSIWEQIYDRAEELSPCFDWGQTASIQTRDTTFDIVPVRYEFEWEYVPGYHFATAPPGAVFLWVFVTVANTGENADSPGLAFGLYYRGKLMDEESWGVTESYPPLHVGQLYPNQNSEGWLLFEVPEAIDLSDAYLTMGDFYGTGDMAWRFRPK